MAAMAEAKIGCPKCGGHMVFPTDLAGQEIACPHCGETILLPKSKRVFRWVVVVAISVVVVSSAIIIWKRKPAPVEPSEGKAVADVRSPPEVEVLQGNKAGLDHKIHEDDAESQFDKAQQYYYGVGVAEDKVEAVKWFTKAAEQGSALAQLQLGAMYTLGDGVPEDLAAADMWFASAFSSYAEAAQKGDAKAQYQLGTMYRDGEGVRRSLKEAVKWFAKAAEQGNTNAQFELTQFVPQTKRLVEPVTGAFGWKLGDRLPENLTVTQLDDFGLWHSFKFSTPPFDSGGSLTLTRDRRICGIRVYGDLEDPLHWREAVDRLDAALDEKYGRTMKRHSDHAGMESWDYYYGGDDREVHLEVSPLSSDKGAIVNLDYTDLPLEKLAKDEAAKARRANDEAATRALRRTGL